MNGNGVEHKIRVVRIKPNPLFARKVVAVVCSCGEGDKIFRQPGQSRTEFRKIVRKHMVDRHPQYPKIIPLDPKGNAFGCGKCGHQIVRPPDATDKVWEKALDNFMAGRH